MNQHNCIRSNLAFYLMLLSFCFLQSCTTKIKQVVTTTVKVSTSTQSTHGDNEYSVQALITTEAQGEKVIKEHIEDVNALAEPQEMKEDVTSKDKHAESKHKVLVQHTTDNMLTPITRQQSLKSKILHSALQQERNKLITNNINNLIINKAPHGQILIQTIQQALKTTTKDTLLFKRLDLQEQDFIQLTYHPFFREKCKKLICFESPIPMQKSILDALSKSLQGTQIEEVHLVSNYIDSSAIVAFLNNLKYTKVRVLNLSNNGLLCNMVELSNALIGTNVYTLDLSNNFISIPMECANLVGRNLYRTQIRYLDLMANPIESKVQQFLMQNFNIIHWKFLQLIFLELF